MLALILLYFFFPVKTVNALLKKSSRVSKNFDTMQVTNRDTVSHILTFWSQCLKKRLDCLSKC